MLRIGTQSDTWYDDRDPDGSLAFYKKCGFTAIDFDLNNYMDSRGMSKGLTPLMSFYDKSLEEIYEHFAPFKAALEKYDIEVAQIHGPFPNWISGKDDYNEYLMMVMEKCLAISAFLGCPGVVIHPVEYTGDIAREGNLRMYRHLIPAAKKYGVKILLENIFARFNGRFKQGRMSHPEEAIEYFDMLNAEAGFEAFGFCFDVGHAIITCQDIPAFIRRMGHRITNLHIHDNNGLDDLHLMPYSCLTTGANFVSDWDGIVEALRDIGYRGALCFETFKSVRIMPEAVRGEVLSLISAIGRHWSDRILGEEKT